MVGLCCALPVSYSLFCAVMLSSTISELVSLSANVYDECSTESVSLVSAVAIVPVVVRDVV